MLNGFLSKNKNTTVLDVVYWSSCKVEEKHYHQNIKDIKDLLKFKVHSSGGTDVSYLHEWIKDFYKNQYIGVINITDGYFSYERDIPNNIVQYDFVLTERNMEEGIIEGYSDKRVKAHTIKKAG
jgi:threonyl-tRNA synthetase